MATDLEKFTTKIGWMIAAFVFNFFSAFWIMLGLGVLHSHKASVPALSYLETYLVLNGAWFVTSFLRLKFTDPIIIGKKG